MHNSFKCVHEKTVEDGALMKCALLPEAITLAGPASKGYACIVACKPTWNGDPTGSSLPGFIKEQLLLNQPYIQMSAANQPSWCERMKSASSAMARFIAGGGKLLPKDEVRKRLDVCLSNGCGQLGKQLGKPVCNACGCFLQIKTRLPAEHCPLRLWDGDGQGRCGGCGK